MRTGIAINFSTEQGPAHVDFASTVQGFAAIAQNGLVNLGTREGTDVVYPTKGTGLFTAAVVGGLISEKERAHETALAAEKTRLFLRGREQEEGIDVEDELISKVGMGVKSVDFKKIVFNAYFVNVNNQQIGEPLVNVL